jgi:transcriptional regulator with XRE-family HTH domain
MTNTQHLHHSDGQDSPTMVEVVADALVKTAAPVLPDVFWQADSLQKAFASRHFGQLLKAYRNAYTPTLKQDYLASWLGITQGQVSRIERSDTPVTDLAKLSRWALRLHIPTDYLWFSPDSCGCSSTAESLILDTGQSEDENVKRRTLLRQFRLGASFLTVSAVQGIQVAETVQGIQVAKASPLQYKIGKSDVEFIREMTSNFRRLDNRFGGGHAYSIVDNYLTSHVEPTIRAGRYSASLRSGLFLAAAELHQLAGWMAYDMADQANGRRHLHAALKLCEEVRNDGLAAEMLAGMSHQASFNRQADNAVELASAAGYTARRAGLPKLQAEAAVMEAHGLALRGDHRGCITALQRAEQHFVRETTESPEWLGYFDEAYLSAKFGHALRDLKRPIDAERFARNSLKMTEGYERARLFNNALLAGVLADQGKLDESIQHASLAVKMSDGMRSVRTVTFLTDVYNRLLPYKNEEPVKALYRSMKGAGVRVAN